MSAREGSAQGRPWDYPLEPSVINKIDLALHVGASLAVMDRDARKLRGEGPFVFTNLKSEEGLGNVVAWVDAQMQAESRRTLGSVREPLHGTLGGHTHGDGEHHHHYHHS